MSDNDHTAQGGKGDQAGPDLGRGRDHVDLSEKRYDLLDDSTPEPVNLAPSDEAPAVNPVDPTDED